ncbi:glycosyltransferase [Enemella dayhoffiae]|uniref:glycosyltransferase n=1 Tax=Enemella dayhoffiae TaxID=2016507 RepID=UPI0015958536|nr:glycosyltransferase [Enemella dayhoffiae]
MVTAEPVRLDRGWTVPGNRWDLLAGVPAAGPPAVSVVVPYFRDQAGLDRIVAALEAQDHPRELLELVVADDGSPEPPRLETALRHRLVRQDDHGFRAAAARNLGLAAAEGEVVAFLDGDCVPEPGWLTALTRLPALAPEALVVGRREHRSGGRVLPDPGWLADGYAATANLLHADDGSWRFMISANLAGHREFLRELGGFDGSLVGYGGEDWELAARAWSAGALLAHEPAAVVVHDGPDWAGRPEDHRAQKNAESLALATRMASRFARPRAFGAPLLTARLGSGSVPAALVCVDSLLDAVPLSVVAVPDVVLRALPSDPRIVRDLPPQRPRPHPGRPVAPWQLELTEPVRFTGALRDLIDQLGGRPDPPGRVTGQGWELTSARARARLERTGQWLFDTVRADSLTDLEIGAPLPPDPDLEGWFGGWWS